MARPKNYQRETVLEQALEVFWSKGYAATSLSDLIEATGLNKRSLYNEFGNKEEMFLAVLGHYQNQRKAVLELLTHQPLGMHNIHKVLRAMGEHIDTRGCLVVLSMQEKELLSPEILTQITSCVSQVREGFQVNIEASTFNQPVNTEALANLLSSQTFGIAGMGKINIGQASIQAAIEQLIDLLPEDTTHRNQGE